MKTISRRRLYAKVWEIPMMRLAKSYGISDVGLAKICKKYNIPRPPRGYWAKIQAGLTLKKTPLPNKSSNETIAIHASLLTELKHKVKDDMDQLKEQQLSFKPVHVPKYLRTPHPLVDKALELLEVGKTDDNGILKPPLKKCLDVKVSPKSLKRALRIWDAILKAFENHQYHVSIEENGTWAKVLGEELSFGIKEELDSEKVNAKHNALKGYYEFGHSRFDYIRKPSGRLCLTIHQIKGYWATNARKNWRDTKTKRLENLLDKFLQGLVRLVLQKKVHDKEEEERRQRQREIQRQREEQERLIEELRLKIEAEKQRVNQLVKDAENRHKSKRIREFIEDVCNEYINGNRIYYPASDLKNWIKWANQQADRIDPLAPNEPSILDEKSKLTPEKRNRQTNASILWDYDE